MDPNARGLLRAARKNRGLSLRELARRVGVSASLLSQIENGHSDPSVSTLYALVAELELSLDSLLEPSEAAADRAGVTAATAAAATGTEAAVAVEATPDGASGPIIRPRERRVLHMDSGVTWERLTRGPSDVDALLVTYEPGGSSSSTGKLMTHNDIEFAYLLEGELTLQLGFDTHVLGAGDSLEFDSAEPHLFYNAGPVAARGIWYVLRKETIATQQPLRTLMGAAVPEAPTAFTSAVQVLESFRQH
ncbi:helix-turn-helix domain-containing protein [Cryptosporangium phraense]|uniref:Helix-turn-helix domain-containing protein n=1 Tax=Cryptosporangium phraense TaxID=2593070 RepID=A0A545AQ52_9ACTN|nr:helix-turn-helix domain-containing protein [Cryptosporangium phraense]TQS43400.1 helix-turn-helix domain-containing protein [Cryptosporangium phraense]